MNHYLLLTARTPNFNPEDGPKHYEYLDRLKEEGRLVLFGPFGDSTGGAYVVKASSMEEAETIGRNDPIIRSGSSRLTVKEWRLR